MQPLFQDFISFGRELFQQGVNHSHSGNMSVRKGDIIYITKHDSRLGSLGYTDIVRANLNNENADKQASIEVKVHRAIYQRTRHQAIVHAHPLRAIVMSLVMKNEKEIVPLDAEGLFYLPQIPILDVIDTIGTQGLINSLPPALEEYPAVIVRGHGSFSVGKNLEEAFKYTSVLDQVCSIAYYTRLGERK